MLPQGARWEFCLESGRLPPRLGSSLRCAWLHCIKYSPSPTISMHGSSTARPAPPAVSWGSCHGKEIRRSQNGDPLKSPQRQQVPAVSCDDMCCPNRRCAFQDLVVVWVSGNGLELTGDGNNAQKREQVRYRIERLLRSEGELRLKLLRQLVEQFAAGHAIDHAGARQFEAQERLALPADS